MIKKTIRLSMFLALFSGCTSMKDSDKATRVTATGTIEKLGVSTFQYGTHILKTERKLYALKSSAINLDTYVSRKVTIKGEKIAGYPLDGGPTLVEVTLVKF